MKILIGSNWNIDFDGPIEMNPEQYQKFISYMNKTYKVVQIEEADELRAERMGSKLFFKNWEFEELYYILDPTLTTDELTEMLGRTWMSINIKRGWYMAAFNRWCMQKGKNIFKEDIKVLIKQFINEKKELFEKRIREKKEIRDTKKAIDKIMDECAIGTIDYGNECVNGFHEGCITCPFSQKYIKTKSDIERFNKVYDEFFS